MKVQQKTLAFLCFALALPAPALAQSELILPQNLDDIRQLSKQAEAGPCDKCGVVTHINSKQRELRHRQNTTAPGSPAMAIGCQGISALSKFTAACFSSGAWSRGNTPAG